ncbi:MULTISPECIES: TrkH family potassium uptake protein [Pelosinus]|uniref:Potassium uptake protein, TrkH family n=1 Tax=Pelosinus fermentans B4 TaxID=1149862 RepID=I9LB69_9FIRM|nr:MULTISPECIES: TrkH family potassium uptake protein [Pelosinus]EIW17679.1 potassium uptake protein, TrkH family [Pelosinus fermentans B4]EIW23640.1 potassium uptake protein, TrkH family [Pelosinus fermentans A11]OAM94565.1 potassium uptake protein, TrkH family [Pelosinus fermentans DSM 17108]SDR12425.1 trk system potassium uptake protein TrkH [Pelosinus fermentans]
MIVHTRFANLFDISQWKLTPYQILALGFAGLIVAGALLLMTPVASTTGQGLSFIDALFTATSAVCVTGLVVVDTGTYFSIFGQMVIIVLIQAGALGIMTMATLMALIMRRKIQLRERLIMQEALNHMTVSGVVRLTQYIIFATFLLEFIGGTILAIHWYSDLGSTGIYYGYWHAVSAFCNAGFDLFGSSLTSYVDDVTVNLTVTSLIILGGLGFTVIFDVWNNRRWKKLSLHTKLVLITTFVLLIFGTVVILLLEMNNPNILGELSWKGKILASYFQSVAPRTAGYNTVDIGKMQDATLFFTIILMFIGASPASTGGGVKTTTLGVMIAAIWALITGKHDAEIFRRRINQNIIYKAFTVFFIAATLVIIVTMMMSISEEFSFLRILFEVVSAFGTVGLSTGITSSLTVHGKLWLIITMFAGRIGPVTFVLALALRSRKGAIHYPEGKINIG